MLHACCKFCICNKTPRDLKAWLIVVTSGVAQAAALAWRNRPEPFVRAVAGVLLHTLLRLFWPTTLGKLPDLHGLHVCSRGHPLHHSPFADNSFVCDVCSVVRAKGCESYSCRPCDFDMCNLCAAKATMQPSDEDIELQKEGSVVLRRDLDKIAFTLQEIEKLLSADVVWSIAERAVNARRGLSGLRVAGDESSYMLGGDITLGKKPVITIQSWQCVGEEGRQVTDVKIVDDFHLTVLYNGKTVHGSLTEDFRLQWSEPIYKLLDSFIMRGDLPPKQLSEGCPCKDWRGPVISNIRVFLDTSSRIHGIGYRRLEFEMH